MSRVASTGRRKGNGRSEGEREGGRVEYTYGNNNKNSFKGKARRCACRGVGMKKAGKGVSTSNVEEKNQNHEKQIG